MSTSMQRKSKVKPMAHVSYGKKSMQLPPLCAFDFETDGLGGAFIVGAFVTDDDDPIRALFFDLGACLDFIVSHPQYRYLAHNASGYEFAYLYPYLYDYFLRNDAITLIPTLQGDTRIVQICIVKDGKKWVDIRDTLCLWPMPLEKVAQSFVPELPKLKKNINFEKETFNPDNPAHIEYVFRDCDIVLQAYVRHARNIADVFGSPLGVTAGSTALKAFYACIPQGHVYYRLGEQCEEFCRKAYYGGLVLPGRTLGNWGYITGIDVNAAYAYQMGSHTFPVGRPGHTLTYWPGRSGIYHVRARVSPDVYERIGFNPLPHREPGGLVWPTGEFETTITHVELAYARSVGCECDIIEGYVWFREEPVFEQFVQKCQEMELFNKGQYKQSIKIIRNSAYGKFGSRPSHRTLAFSKETLVGGNYVPLTVEETGQLIDGVYIGTETTQSEYMMPHWAAFITAYQRVYIMQFIQKAYELGATNVYADTDSIKADTDVIDYMVQHELVPIGNEYGQFKMEDRCNEFTLVGPKCFTGTVGTSTFIRAKGIPNRVLREEMEVCEDGSSIYRNRTEIFHQAISGIREPVEFTAVESVMNIIKRNCSVRPIQRKRKMTDMKNSFAWEITQDGSIYPRGYLACCGNRSG